MKSIREFLVAYGEYRRLGFSEVESLGFAMSKPSATAPKETSLGEATIAADPGPVSREWGAMKTAAGTDVANKRPPCAAERPTAFLVSTGGATSIPTMKGR